MPVADGVFVLTVAGRRRAGSGKVHPDGDVPFYDKGDQDLWFRGKRIKCLTRTADNQTAILEKFQREGWPPRIDYPLERDGLVNPKKRLHDAVQRLNQGQRSPRLRFGRDGKGGVYWRPLTKRRS
jgi:hypothetical protein